MQDGAKRQGALAKAPDHLFAAGLDALGDRHFTLATQQLDRAHLAQIHTHGIIGSADIIVVQIAFGGRLLLLVIFFVFLWRGGGSAVLGLLAFDDTDAHLRTGGHPVPDLFRRDLVGRDDLSYLIIGDIAPLLRAGHPALDCGLRFVAECTLGRLLADFAILPALVCFACHSVLVPRSSAAPEKRSLAPKRLTASGCASCSQETPDAVSFRCRCGSSCKCSKSSSLECRLLPRLPDTHCDPLQPIAEARIYFFWNGVRPEQGFMNNQRWTEQTIQ